MVQNSIKNISELSKQQQQLEEKKRNYTTSIPFHNISSFHKEQHIKRIKKQQQQLATPTNLVLLLLQQKYFMNPQIEKDLKLPVNVKERRTPFKDPNYQKSKMLSTDKKKSLKQIIMMEKQMSWDKESVHYSSIDSEAPSKPVKKYSDISGLEAKYQEPTSKLYYANVEEYPIIVQLTSDISAGYLNLRKSNFNL